MHKVVRLFAFASREFSNGVSLLFDMVCFSRIPGFLVLSLAGFAVGIR